MKLFRKKAGTNLGKLAFPPSPPPGADLRGPKPQLKVAQYYVDLVRASGEAILGTQRYY